MSFLDTFEQQIENFSEHTVDKSVEDNADFHYQAGLSPKIVRSGGSDCCEWCSGLSRTYKYPDVPSEVYARHANCNCDVEYYPGDGRKQNVHSKKWNKDSNRPMIEERKHIGNSDKGSTIDENDVLRKPDFYTGPNKKTILAKYEEWIGENERDALMSIGSDKMYLNAINEIYRPGSFIGDGSVADILRFENSTGLMCGRSGSHLQKCEDMLKYINNKVLTRNLSAEERNALQRIASNLQRAILGQ